MNYLEIPRDERKTVKINSKYHNIIKSFRMNGMTYREIGEKFDVHSTTIWCIVNPERAREAQKKTKKNNYPKYRENNLKSKKLFHKNRYSETIYRNYILEYNRKQYAEIKIRLTQNMEFKD